MPHTTTNSMRPLVKRPIARDVLSIRNLLLSSIPCTPIFGDQNARLYAEQKSYEGFIPDIELGRTSETILNTREYWHTLEAFVHSELDRHQRWYASALRRHKEANNKHARTPHDIRAEDLDIARLIDGVPLYTQDTMAKYLMSASTWRLHDPVKMDEIVMASSLVRNTVPRQFITVGEMAFMLSRCRRQFFTSMLDMPKRIPFYENIMQSEVVFDGQAIENADWWWDTIRSTNTYEMWRGGSDDSSLAWMWLATVVLEPAFPAKRGSSPVSKDAALIKSLRQHPFEKIVPYIAANVTDGNLIAQGIQYDIDPDIIAEVASS